MQSCPHYLCLMALSVHRRMICVCCLLLRRILQKGMAVREWDASIRGTKGLSKVGCYTAEEDGLRNRDFAGWQWWRHVVPHDTCRYNCTAVTMVLEKNVQLLTSCILANGTSLHNRLFGTAFR